MDAPVRRCERINISEGRRGRERPKKSLDEVIREDLKVASLTEDIAQDRKLWRDRIKTVDRGESSPYVVLVCRLYCLPRTILVCLLWAIRYMTFLHFIVLLFHSFSN